MAIAGSLREPLERQTREALLQLFRSWQASAG
jgi:hypothetical protein